MNTSATPIVQAAPTVKTSPLPTVVMILGIIETLFLTLLFIYYLFLIPRLMQLYEGLNIQIANPYLQLSFQAIFIIFPIAEAYYGYWLRKLQKTKHELPLKHRRIIYSIFFITFLLFIFSIIGTFISSLRPLMLLQQELR
jgi:hypothetical protein